MRKGDREKGVDTESKRGKKKKASVAVATETCRVCGSKRGERESNVGGHESVGKGI